MPQLVKGGKYVFGWSMVRINRDIIIPDEAYLEYGFINDKKAILMSGSKKSGGFGLSSKRLLSNTPIGILLMKYPDLINYKINEGEIKEINNRVFSWVNIKKEKSINLTELLLDAFNLEIIKKLLVIRGSGLALGFITSGPIYEEAKKHPEILTF
ncbi:MAG: hypothetical protein EU531_02265 [Promethearchaeota archaeon]|nr:MAG: hypothetical protein EU531_02265 [Candidatus Lokiarchaeota archaeon]